MDLKVPLRLSPLKAIEIAGFALVFIILRASLAVWHGGFNLLLALLVYQNEYPENQGRPRNGLLET
jgi:hypothetical protein